MNLPKFSFPKAVPREPDPPGVATATMQFVFFLTVWAFALLGSLWMLVVFITGSVGRVDWFTSYEATEAGVKTNTWTVAADIHWAIAGGLFLFCAAIAIYNAVWLEMRRHTAPGLMRNVLTGIGIAVALFMISGATVVQQRGTDARARDDVIAAQSAQAGAAGIAAQIAAIDQRLATMRDKRVNNEYAATAANVGADAYRAQYMNPAIMARETPERRRLIERALGAAITAEKLEADKLALSAQLGAATVLTVRETARTVKAEGFMSSTATVLEDLRKPVTAILGELLAMTVLSAALAAWASRRQAMAGAAPMSDAFQIEDQTALTKEMGPVKSDLQMGKMVDALTGEELVPVKGAKPHFRKKGKTKTGKAVYEAELPGAPPMPDDVGAPVSPHDPRVFGEVANNDERDAGNLGGAEPASSGADSHVGGDSVENVRRSAGDDLMHLSQQEEAGDVSGSRGSEPDTAPESETLDAQQDEVVAGSSADEIEVADDASQEPPPVAEPAHEELTPEVLAAKIDAGEIAELSDEPGVFVEVIKADSHDSFANRRGLPAPEKEVA